MNRLLKLYKIVINKKFTRALLNGCAPTIEHEAVLKASQSRFVVDIGANRGQFAIAVREYLPSAVIHSIEPLSEPAQILERLFYGDPKFFLHTCAIGSQHRTGLMYVSKLDYSSSLLPISEKLLELFPFADQHEVRNVAVLPLREVIDAQWIESPAFLKIDVQGFELNVLQGCMGLLEKFEYIYVECSFVELYVGQALAQDVIMFLGNAGFQLNGIYDVYYDHARKAIQADFLFVRKPDTEIV
jgi:FkbM family methyltransferase